MGKQPRTDLALSRLCLKRTRPPFSSAQPKVSPRFSSWASVPPPLPSSPNRSSSPLLGTWTRLKTSRSDGLSGSVTCSRVAGSGANAPRGTSREPLTRRTGGRLFTVEGRKWNEYKSHLSIIRLSESLREKFILELQVWFCFRDSSCRNETYKKQWREGIERSMSHTLKSICHFFLFKINQHLWKGADLPLRMFDSVSTKHDGNLRDGENNGGYETGGLTGGPCQASHSNCARQKRMFQPSGRRQACFPGCRIGFDGLWRSISASSVQTHSLRRAQTASGAAQNPSKQTRAACFSCLAGTRWQRHNGGEEASPCVWSQGRVVIVCSLQSTSITVSCKQKRLKKPRNCMLASLQS